MHFHATSWTVDESENTGGYPQIVIDQCRQRDGSHLYAVRQAGCCMSVSGVWEFEPTPSSRDDDFIDRCRFKNWEDAAKAINRYCTPLGRFSGRV